MGERKRDKEFECIVSKLELCGRRVESITFFCFSSTMKFYFFSSFIYIAASSGSDIKLVFYGKNL